MNSIDKTLHHNIHSSMMSGKPFGLLKNPRLKLLDFFENKFAKVKGTVLDVGAGSGYASIKLGLKSDVGKVYALDASEKACNELIPKNAEYFNLEEKVVTICASFSDIPLSECIDFAVSFGSLHHSKCLFSTFRAVSSSLKEGSFLLVQEPAMPDFTTNLEYQKKYDCIESKFGVKIRNGDRDDHFFRVSEYIIAAQFCGMDLLYSGDFYSLQSKFQKFKETFRNWGNREDEDNISFQTRKVIPKVFVFKKHKKKIPIAHLWQPLRIG